MRATRRCTKCAGLRMLDLHLDTTTPTGRLKCSAPLAAAFRSRSRPRDTRRASVDKPARSEWPENGRTMSWLSSGSLSPTCARVARPTTAAGRIRHIVDGAGASAARQVGKALLALSGDLVQSPLKGARL